MDRKQTAVVLMVLAAALGAAVYFIYQPPAPAQAVQDEFSTIDEWLSDLDDYLDFENQDFDYDLGDIIENWELSA